MSSMASYKMSSNASHALKRPNVLAIQIRSRNSLPEHLFNTNRNEAENITANRSTAREQSYHYDQVSPRQEEFTEDEDGASWSRCLTKDNRSHNKTRKRKETPVYYSAKMTRNTQTKNRHEQHEDSFSEDHYNDQE